MYTPLENTASTPRILFVEIRSEIFKVNILVVHAPWCARGGRLSDAVKEKVEAFWKELRAELEAMPDVHRTPLVVMADANARIGEYDNRVGSLAPDEVDFQGSLFLDFLSQLTSPSPGPRSASGLRDCLEDCSLQLGIQW